MEINLKNGEISGDIQQINLVELVCLLTEIFGKEFKISLLGQKRDKELILKKDSHHYNAISEFLFNNYIKYQKISMYIYSENISISLYLGASNDTCTLRFINDKTTVAELFKIKSLLEETFIETKYKILKSKLLFLFSFIGFGWLLDNIVGLMIQPFDLKNTMNQSILDLLEVSLWLVAILLVVIFLSLLLAKLFTKWIAGLIFKLKIINQEGVNIAKSKTATFLYGIIDTKAIVAGLLVVAFTWVIYAVLKIFNPNFDWPI